MLSEFESRLANVLGARLAAPLSGAVDVSPGQNSTRIALGVQRVDPIEEDLLSTRPERVPGGADPRRVVRLRCEVGFEVRQPPGGDRVDQMTAVDRTLYLLGEAGFRDGSALLPDDDSDPGFLIRRMRFLRSEPPADLTIEVEGYFWPVGEVGETGPSITETRIRNAIQPLQMLPRNPLLVASGDPVDLRIEFGATGTMRIEAEGIVTGLPYGSILVSVVDAGGRPGAGTLSGGLEGPGGSRILSIEDGAATLQYTPPAEAADERLVIAIENSEGGAGLVLNRFPLKVRGS